MARASDEDILNALCSVLDPAEFSFTVGHDEIIDRLCKLVLVGSPIEAELVVEHLEPGLRETMYTSGWAVRYNAITDRFHFDRLPPFDYLQRVVEHHARALPRQLGRRLELLSPRQFELLIGTVLNRLPGHSRVRVSKASRDGGVDFEALFHDLDANRVIAVVGQAKHWKTKVGSGEIHKLIGTMAVRGRRAETRGMVVSLAGLTAPAERLARNSPMPITVHNRDDLVAMLLSTGVGVRRKALTLESEDDAFWSELVDL